MTATPETEVSRRSQRLVLGGYYNQSSEEEESSLVSYRENPVRVFSKRKKAGRKGASSRRSSRANSVSSTSSLSSSKASTMDPPISPPAYSGFSHLIHRKTCHDTPRPAPTPAPGLNPSTNSWSFSTSQASHAPRPITAVDSSGYSSSEARNYKGNPAHSPSDGQRVSANHSSGVGVRGIFASTLTRPFKPAAVAKAIVAALLLIFFIYVCCLLVSLVWPTPTGSKILNQPSISSNLPPAFTPPSKAMDKDSVSDAVLVAKIKNVLSEEILEKQAQQQEFVTKINTIVERLQIELRDVRSDVTMRLDREHPLYSDHRISEMEAAYTKQLDEFNHRYTNIGQRMTALEEQMAKWLRVVNQVSRSSPPADRMPNFALESQGASLVSTRCSETYRSRSACVSFLGVPLWYPSESPRIVIQGNPPQAGRCWPFHGAQGTLVIALSHPARITHVTLEHLPVVNAPSGRIDSAPKDFSVHGMSTETDEGTFLGTFMYDRNGDPMQTFQMPNPAEAVYTFVELRVLSNWGHPVYTCIYSFRVHGHMDSYR
ncbi:hypothetical protein DPEC_G00269960 [Dallia pectoralis]|uniref:Uncharacterized protein n=1 Tax=Dallia pectoralis TaxID=75939 RepID=A0ACC2FP70_DALPE|nr:hypothetical protein DPEC_G00269960 [Dallia pectoralis]